MLRRELFVGGGLFMGDWYVCTACTFLWGMEVWYVFTACIVLWGGAGTCVPLVLFYGGGAGTCVRLVPFYVEGLVRVYGLFFFMGGGWYVCTACTMLNPGLSTVAQNSNNLRDPGCRSVSEHTSGHSCMDVSFLLRVLLAQFW